MRFKVFAALLATVVLMGAAVAAASATNRSSQTTTAQTTATTQPTATKLEPAAGLVGDDAGTCALLKSGAVECWGNNTTGARWGTAPLHLSGIQPFRSRRRGSPA